MAGHSKWSNIQHRKGRQDAKKAKIFTKIIREITVAARSGADVSHNSALRLALDKAYSNNMGKDAVERAIKRGSGENDSDSYFSATYEGYASGGVAVLVECLTDNINRTVSDVRHCFTKFGGNLGTTGSVAYLFSPLSYFVVRANNEDSLLEAILDFEIQNIEKADNDSEIKDLNNELFEITAEFSDYSALKDRLAKKGFEIVFSEQTKIANNQIDCDESSSQNVSKVIEILEDLDDVQNVFHNANLTQLN